MTEHTVVTHHGIFHADEVVGVAILKIVYGEDLQVIRTRDEKVINEHQDKGAWVIDVGGKYIPDERRLDHHMREGGPAPRPGGIPYASAGLVWRHFGDLVIQKLTTVASHDACKEIAETVDKEFVSAIDASDCGAVEGHKTLRGTHGAVRVPTVSFNQIIFGMNREVGDRKDFDKAVELAVTVLLDVIRGVSRKSLSAIRVRGAAPLFKGVIQFSQYEPAAMDVISREFPEILYVIFPDDASNTWRVQEVPSKPGSFNGRKSLPEPWAGLQGEELDKVTGITGGIFCHPNRFLAGHTTLSGAVALAQMALEE